MAALVASDQQLGVDAGERRRWAVPIKLGVRTRWRSFIAVFAHNPAARNRKGFSVSDVLAGAHRKKPGSGRPVAAASLDNQALRGVSSVGLCFHLPGSGLGSGQLGKRPCLSPWALLASQASDLHRRPDPVDLFAAFVAGDGDASAGAPRPGRSGDVIVGLGHIKVERVADALTSSPRGTSEATRILIAALKRSNSAIRRLIHVALDLPRGGGVGASCGQLSHGRLPVAENDGVLEVVGHAKLLLASFLSALTSTSGCSNNVRGRRASDLHAPGIIQNLAASFWISGSMVPRRAKSGGSSGFGQSPRCPG